MVKVSHYRTCGRNYIIVKLVRSLVKLLRYVAMAVWLDFAASPLSGQTTADVVVVVDTSTSISKAGMDPERTSLLVAKLLADIVPGDLAVVRLLDLSKDARW